MEREVQLSSLERELQNQTRRMNYPDFGAFHLADNLFGNLSESYLNNESAGGKVEFEDEISLFRLGSALKSTKDLYLKNGINFNQDDFHTDEDLATFPRHEGLKEVVKGLNDNTNDIRDLYIHVAKAFCEKIEDGFYPIMGIENMESNPRQRDFVKEKLKKIAEFARYSKNIGTILSGHDEFLKGGHLAKAMDGLSNEEHMYTLFENNDLYLPFSNVIGVHAGLHDLSFNGDAFSFFGNTGGEIGNIMGIGNTFFNDFHAATGFALSNKEDMVVFPRGEEVEFYNGGKRIRKEWKNDWVKCIGDLMNERKEDLERRINSIKSPFNELDKKLFSLGVPYELAEKLVEGWIDEFAPTLNTTGRRFSNKKMYTAIHKQEGKNYIDAVSNLVQKTIGKKPNPVNFRYFDEKESRRMASGIAPVTYVVKNTNRKLEVLREDWTKLTDEEVLDDLSKQYGPEDADVYLRENRGVCYISELTASADQIPPKSSLIETRFMSGPVKKYDELGSKLAQAQVDVHEMIHAAQVKTPLVYRDSGAFVAYIAANEALRMMKQGRLNEEIPYYRNKSIFAHGDTWKDLWVDFLDTESAQFLGKGKFSKVLKQEGISQALWKRGHRYTADFDSEILREMSPLENSITSSNVLNLRNYILGDDLEGLKNCHNSLYQYFEETGMLMEQAAETFSILGMEKYIMNIPDARYSQEGKENYFNNLKDGILMRGILGKKFLDIMQEDISTEEKDRLLDENGMRYQHVINDKEVDGVERRLIYVDYPSLNPYAAYGDMEKLGGKRRAYGWTKNEVHTPMNSARAYLDEKYSINIPLMLDVVDKFGPEKAFEKIHDLETIDQLKELAVK